MPTTSHQIRSQDAEGMRDNEFAAEGNDRLPEKHSHALHLEFRNQYLWNGSLRVKYGALLRSQTLFNVQPLLTQ